MLRTIGTWGIVITSGTKTGPSGPGRPEASRVSCGTAGGDEGDGARNGPAKTANMPIATESAIRLIRRPSTSRSHMAEVLSGRCDKGPSLFIRYAGREFRSRKRAPDDAFRQIQT